MQYTIVVVIKCTVLNIYKTFNESPTIPTFLEKIRITYPQYFLGDKESTIIIFRVRNRTVQNNGCNQPWRCPHHMPNKLPLYLLSLQQVVWDHIVELSVGEKVLKAFKNPHENKNSINKSIIAEVPLKSCSSNYFQSTRGHYTILAILLLLMKKL